MDLRKLVEEEVRRQLGLVEEQIVFDESVTSTIGRQINLEITAIVNGEPAGYLTYSEYKDEINILMVETFPKFRNQGIAKELVLYLQSLYPKTELSWGMVTTTGERLRKSLERELYVDHRRKRQIQELEKEINELKSLKLRLIAELDRAIDRGDNVDKIGSELNDTEDRINELKQELNKYI